MKWWQKAVFYQIYPRSFADGNGDGIGDFIGMTAKLDYLVDLGIDAVWLSPHFPSSNHDVGYDITDYVGVAPEYGTLDDFKRFLDEAHQRDIRVILDLVANHSSDEHPWFLESKSSKNNPRADWYIWKDSPPNNWQSCFDGDAWTYCPERDQYYYHYFLKQQPDLNWHNPEVREAMGNVVRFWLDMGVDGFRLDAICTIFEDPAYPNHSVPHTFASLRQLSEDAKTPQEIDEVDQYWKEIFKYQIGLPEVHDVMKELRCVLDEYEGDRLLVGEDDDIRYLGNGSDELDLVFNFPLMRPEKLLTPAFIRANQRTRLKALEEISPDAWPCNTFGNHDTPRSHNRYGDGIHDAELARLTLALLLTMKGTPFIYNGEEIGMTDLHLTDASDLRDSMATWFYEQKVQTLGIDPVDAAKQAGEISRDKNRTQMQWANEPNAGFSPAGVKTWLPVNPNYRSDINIKDQQSNPASMLNFTKKLLRLRRAHAALSIGSTTELESRSENVLAYQRQFEDENILVVLNFSADRIHTSIEKYASLYGNLLYSSAGRSIKQINLNEIMMGSFEILIIDIK